MNLTPLSQMNTETFARRMTGAESLNDDQKKQIREQQEVCLWQFIVNCVYVSFRTLFCLNIRWYGDGTGNTVEDNSSILSLI